MSNANLSSEYPSFMGTPLPGKVEADFSGDPYHWQNSELVEFMRHLRPEQGEIVANALRGLFGIGYDADAEMYRDALIDLRHEVKALLARMGRPEQWSQETQRILSNLSVLVSNELPTEDDPQPCAKIREITPYRYTDPCVYSSGHDGPHSYEEGLLDQTIENVPFVAIAAQDWNSVRQVHHDRLVQVSLNNYVDPHHVIAVHAGVVEPGEPIPPGWEEAMSMIFLDSGERVVSDWDTKRIVAAIEDALSQVAGL